MFKLTLKEMFLITTLSAVCAAWWTSHAEDRQVAESLGKSLQEAQWKVLCAETDAQYYRRTIKTIEQRVNEGKSIEFGYFCHGNGKSEPTLLGD